MATARANARTTRRLVIDARPRGPRGAFADEFVQGRTLLDHQVGLAEAVSAEDRFITLVFQSDENLETPRVHSLKPIVRTSNPPPAGSFVIRTDRLYDVHRLRRALRSGRDPETAVIWRLDHPGGLMGADDELKRRQSYQPLGKYWALDPARQLAEALSPTKVRPNAVTLVAASLMLAASVAVAFAIPSWQGNLIIAAAMVLALVLDTADGHLARLQGTATEFGRYLDAWLDELCDMTLHAGIAWGAFVASEDSRWLLVGMAYAMGKYVFYVANHMAFASDDEKKANSETVRPSFVRRMVRVAGHADIRWHLWIILAAIGRLDLSLLAYAAYYPTRAVLGLAGKAREARHA